MPRATTATIHLDALRHNLQRVRALAPHSKVMAVVKADGYGHGLERVALALEGADAFGVAALSDAERLRAAGLSQRIVLLSGFDEPGDLALLRRLNVDTVVHDDSQLAILEAEADAWRRGRATAPPSSRSPILALSREVPSRAPPESEESQGQVEPDSTQRVSGRGVRDHEREQPINVDVTSPPPALHSKAATLGGRVSGSASAKRVSGSDSTPDPTPGLAETPEEWASQSGPTTRVLGTERSEGVRAQRANDSTADLTPSPAVPIRCWLKIDTGMRRLGFDAERVPEVHARLAALPNVDPDLVLMTHFAASDEFGGEQTAAQLANFEIARDGWGHTCSLANSAAVLGWPQAHADWVRAGGMLYGVSVVAGKSGADFGLEPAMTLSTRLIAIKTVARGEPVGYSATWHCPEDMPVGIAAIGYGDGYPRHAPPGTPVLVNGVRVPVIGRVSMDLMSLDLRAVPGARVGDPVVLWGRGLPVEEIAACADTIGYELVCSITRRVRFVED